MATRMKVKELVDSLMAIHPKGFDLSLGRVTRLLALLGDPQKRIPPVIHVAGTNGKGSTIAFCRTILEASGHKVHAHTSPHLVNWNERYRLGHDGGGQLVTDAVLAEAISRVAEANGGQPITVFEILSAVMFVLFSEHPADFCLVEVGLGGRFDATNVLEKPAICTITPIALDHQAFLGDTIAKIAFEKAGIIKPGAKVVVGPQQEAAREVIEAKAEECRVQIFVAGQDFDYYEQGGRFIYQDEEGLLDLPMPHLIGEHQLGNAATAIATIRATGVKTSNEQFETAMEKVSWPGRMSRLKTGTIVDKLGENWEIWVDGGHNPAAAQAISREIIRQNKQNEMPTIMICGMLNTKEPKGYFDAFNGLVKKIITVPIQSSDAGIDAAELAEIASQTGLKSMAVNSLSEALEILAKNKEKSRQRILVAGSLYLIGDVLLENETPPA
ncbi:MAG: folylpolyglutamate synthase/dihydrofolate synthase family protein [Rhizobiaceae bacterium]